MKSLKKIYYFFYSKTYELRNIFNKIKIFWPSTSFGVKLRYNYYKKDLKRIGNNATIESGVRFGGPELIEIGENCIFGRNVNINAGECKGIFIGNDVAIADGTYLRSANHSFYRLDIPIKDQGHTAVELNFNDRLYSVIIEDDVWVGARAIILSGAWIGRGSIISAGAVVSSIIPPFSIVVGNPGRVVANREKKIQERNEKI
jgi:maltose O-acetyltransferase